MNPYIEIVYALPASSGTVGASQVRATQIVPGLDIAKDANGRAVVLRPLPGAPTGASQQLSTFEDYDRVLARLATITSNFQTARVSTPDMAAATSNRQADVQSTNQAPS